MITGGAGGLGRALTAALVQRGWTVIALDLPSDQLAAMASERVLPLACDLTDPGQLNAAVRQVLHDHAAIDLVVYNAGITQIGLFPDCPPASHRRVFEINYFSAVELARLLLPAVRLARGTHLAVSSVAGFAPLVRRTAYSASKHALEGFFKSLRAEEADHGVAVLIAAPSFIATNPGAPTDAADGIARPGAAGDAIDHMSADDAARIILRGYDRRRAVIPVGRVAWLSLWLSRLAPGLYEAQMRKRIKGS